MRRYGVALVVIAWFYPTTTTAAPTPTLTPYSGYFLAVFEGAQRFPESSFILGLTEFFDFPEDPFPVLHVVSSDQNGTHLLVTFRFDGLHEKDETKTLTSYLARLPNASSLCRFMQSMRVPLVSLEATRQGQSTFALATPATSQPAQPSSTASPPTPGPSDSALYTVEFTIIPSQYNETRFVALLAEDLDIFPTDISVWSRAGEPNKIIVQFRGDHADRERAPGPGTIKP